MTVTKAMQDVFMYKCIPTENTLTCQGVSKFEQDDSFMANKGVTDNRSMFAESCVSCSVRCKKQSFQFEVILTVHRR